MFSSTQNMKFWNLDRIVPSKIKQPQERHFRTPPITFLALSCLQVLTATLLIQWKTNSKPWLFILIICAEYFSLVLNSLDLKYYVFILFAIPKSMGWYTSKLRVNRNVCIDMRTRFLFFYFMYLLYCWIDLHAYV